jgi:conjugative transfer signal peptidase TraF
MRKFLLGVSATLFSALAIAYFSGVIIRTNCSNSLPHSLFLCFPHTGEASKGGFVCFKRDELEMPFMKQVAGVDGDRIEVSSKRISVAGKDRGPVQDDLPPIESKFVPPGHYFVVGWSEDSYDSRYERFGLVADDEILEDAWPIF